MNAYEFIGICSDFYNVRGHGVGYFTWGPYDGLLNNDGSRRYVFTVDVDGEIVSADMNTNPGARWTYDWVTKPSPKAMTKLRLYA